MMLYTGQLQLDQQIITVPDDELAFGLARSLDPNVIDYPTLMNFLTYVKHRYEGSFGYSRTCRFLTTLQAQLLTQHALTLRPQEVRDILNAYDPSLDSPAGE